MFNRLAHFAESAASRVVVKSALNPILWLCVIVFPMALFGAWLFRGSPTIMIVFVVIAILPILVA